LFYHFIIKDNINNVKSVVTESTDGSITISITHSINWKNIIMYLLFIITINLAIVDIIKFIEYKIIIIIAFDIISLILLFPSLISALIFNIMKYYKKQNNEVRPYCV
jgi:hypothetical protein